MNTRLINRLTAVPSFDGQSLARAKQVDCLPERLRPLPHHDQGTARPEPAPYLVASAFRCSRTPPRAFGPGRFFVAENELERPRDGSGRPMDQVRIFDTTLRDGEQSPGISLDVGEKLEIAEQLARLGTDIVEAGFPIASQGDFDAVEAIAKSVRGSTIAALSRTGFKDVDRAWEAVRHAERPRIHVFIATSPIHMKKKLRMTEDQVKHEAAAAVARAKGYCDDVEFSPEDGSRSDADFMCEVCQGAVDNGATTINIPDTVGFGVPEEFAELISYVIARVRGDYVVSTHCHNDLGLAVANSLAGVRAGARQVECAINGLGERAGNAALEEIVMAIKTRSDYFGHLDVNVRTEELARTSRIVSRLTGYPVQYNKAVVGRNAFAHEAGIHQHGVLEDPETYEIMDANTVGQEAAQVVLADINGKIDAEGSGNGMIDAAVAAIAAATGVEGRLTDFQVHAVTGGGDALGDVVVQMEAGGFKVSGRGVSTDVVEASARAYLNAVNRIVRLRERGEEREIEIGP